MAWFSYIMKDDNHSEDKRWYLTKALTYISLMISDVDNILMCLQPFIYLLRKCLSHSSPYFFNQIICCWVVLLLYIFWMLPTYQKYGFQVFSFIPVFSFCCWFPLLCTNFLVWCSFSCLFLYLLPLCLVSNPKNHWPTTGAYAPYSLPGVLWLQVLSLLSTPCYFEGVV